MTDQNDLMEELKRRHPRVHAAFVASEQNGFKFDVAEFFHVTTVCQSSRRTSLPDERRRRGSVAFGSSPPVNGQMLSRAARFD